MFRIARFSCPRLLGYWLIFNVFHAFPRSIERIYRSADSINFKQTHFCDYSTAVFFLVTSAFGNSGQKYDVRYIDLAHTYRQLVKRSVLLTAPCLQHFAAFRMEEVRNYTRRRMRERKENKSRKYSFQKKIERKFTS